MKGLAPIAATAVALVAFSAQSFAADLPQPVDPVPSATLTPDLVPGFDWTGPYAGATLGWGFGTFSTNSIPTGKFDNNANGVIGGLYSGFNFMLSPNILAGIEGDFTLSSLEDRTVVGGVNYKTSSDWNSNVRGRLGYAFDNFLVYGTGGLALADISANANGAKDSKLGVGWTLGAGIESAITDNVLLRMDYAYQDFGKEKFNLGGTTYKTDLSNNLLRAGIAYKF